MRALGSTGSARAPAGSSPGDGVDGWVIDASSLVMMENPGGHSGNLESFPVAGVFDLAARFGTRAVNSGSLRNAPLKIRLLQRLPYLRRLLQIEVLVPIATALARVWAACAGGLHRRPFRDRLLGHLARPDRQVSVVKSHRQGTIQSLLYA